MIQCLQYFPQVSHINTSAKRWGHINAYANDQNDGEEKLLDFCNLVVKLQVAEVTPQHIVTFH